MVDSFPLQWPAGRPRCAARKTAKFGTTARSNFKEPLTIAEAMRRLQDELDHLGAQQFVLSSNLELRLDGLSRSGANEPPDPGVALYFHLGGRPHCMPCDTYDRAADNIAAIAAHIEATRKIERHGVATVAEMFNGFAALPPPGDRPWRDVMEFLRGDDPQITREVIEARFRRLASLRHPDKAGGSTALMAELNAARDETLKEIGNA